MRGRALGELRLQIAEVEAEGVGGGGGGGPHSDGLREGERTAEWERKLAAAEQFT
jgi:hypothetical protein